MHQTNNDSYFNGITSFFLVRTCTLLAMNSHLHRSTNRVRNLCLLKCSYVSRVRDEKKKKSAKFTHPTVSHMNWDYSTHASRNSKNKNKKSASYVPKVGTYTLHIHVPWISRHWSRRKNYKQEQMFFLSNRINRIESSHCGERSGLRKVMTIASVHDQFSHYFNRKSTTMMLTNKKETKIIQTNRQTGCARGKQNEEANSNEIRITVHCVLHTVENVSKMKKRKKREKIKRRKKVITISKNNK